MRLVDPHRSRSPGVAVLRDHEAELRPAPEVSPAWSHRAVLDGAVRRVGEPVLPGQTPRGGMGTFASPVRAPGEG